MLENKPYLLMDGLDEIARNFTGTEHIFLGIKPYGFHAGNKIPFVVYPLLLCKKMLEYGKEPCFSFFVFINDWEQDGFDKECIDMTKFPFNVYPRGTTYQFSKTAEVVYWTQKIVDSVSDIKSFFPNIQIKCVKNSEMRDMPYMKDVVLKTIQNPSLLSDIMKDLGYPIKKDFPHVYCTPICPECKSARTNAKVMNGDYIALECTTCRHKGEYSYYDLYYWLYHKILALPRIKTFEIDLCISGLDHYLEKDFDSRNALYKAYNIKMKPTYILYTNKLLGRNGLQMGKSRNNYEDLDVEQLQKLVLEYPNSMEIAL